MVAPLERPTHRCHINAIRIRHQTEVAKWADCENNGDMTGHNSIHNTIRNNHWTKASNTNATMLLALCALALVMLTLLLAGCSSASNPDKHSSASSAPSSSLNHSKVPDSAQQPSPTTNPTPSEDTSPQSQAKRAVEAMSVPEQVGQLVMVPLNAGTDASVLQDLVANQHVGSVLITGNWNIGVDGLKQSTDELQSYAPDNDKLLIATDQEGGQVQHVQGPGFDAIPEAIYQGQMATDQLRASAAVWGSQLKAAGINVNLAPVVDTVQVDRSANAPIGALDRDFGLDGNGNAQHATAFVNGMRDSGVQTSIKHYPGLGAVTGNTDFTTDGILDTTTTTDGEQIQAFNTTLQSNPAMVMMSLATYQQIDGSAPAAFSSKLIRDQLRGQLGYDGVITSDSLSATALSGIDPSQLGVRLVEAGGDLACIGAGSYIQPIIDGLNQQAASNPDFAANVKQSAIRVMTLKYEMGIAS